MNTITFSINPHGAELSSLRMGEREYLWQGDPAFWGRRAPILFPIVGKVAHDTLRVSGQEYAMKQHGFARDVDFELCPGDEGAHYVLHAPDGRPNYPFSFDLTATYRADGDILTCQWTVINRDNRPMDFQIGAHPAFLLPDFDPADDVHGYIQCLDREGKAIAPTLDHYLIDGLRHPFETPESLPTQDGLLPITDRTFAHDAFIIERGQVATTILFDKQGRKVLSVSCPQAEAYGLWAPAKPGCPFVCLEPWCGIADRDNFNGDIADRDCNHHLLPGETFDFCYGIQVF